MCENTDEAKQSLRDEKLSAEQHKIELLAEKDSIAAEAGYKLGMLSYEAEMARYDSLISATSHLMTFVSIESIVLVTLLATLLEHTSLSPCHVAICYLIIFALLIATLAVALAARLRFSYMAPAAPAEYGTRVKEQFSEFVSKSDGASFFCDCIQESYASVRSRNNKISKLVGFANALALLNLAAVALSVISLLSTIPFLT